MTSPACIVTDAVAHASVSVIVIPPSNSLLPITISLRGPNSTALVLAVPSTADMLPAVAIVVDPAELVCLTRIVPASELSAGGRSFKSWATHAFGLVYYDERGRSGNVNPIKFIEIEKAGSWYVGIESESSVLRYLVNKG